MNETAPLGRRRPVLLPWVLWYLAALPCPYLAAEDCNGNGREDRLDIARGESPDCNRDGVPDECEEERDLFFVTRERQEICGHPRHQGNRLVSEDLDQDGDEDIAVVCTNQVLSLLWNRGDGSFEPVENLELDIRASQVLCDDFDRDGDPDLLLINTGSLQGGTLNRMDLYQNDGVGRFELVRTLRAGRRVWTGTSGDLDGDGDPDVVAIGSERVEAEFNDWNLFVTQNRGDGTFEEPRLQEAGFTPTFAHIADVDGDGLGDIVTVLWRRGVSVLKNRGDLAFEGPEVYEAGPGPARVDSGDLDGDGDLDLAVGNKDTTILALLFNDGAGGFEDLRLVDAQGARDPDPVRVADIDRDGDLDVLTSGLALFAYYNAGGGRFGPPVRFGAGRPRWPSLGDFDGDGWMDVAVTTWDGMLTILRNRGGAFAATRTYPVNFTSLAYDATSVVALDLESDGDLDLAVLNSNLFGPRDAIALLRNGGEGQFSDLEHVVPRTRGGFRPQNIHSLDIDGDGDLDLLVGGGTRFGFLINEGGTFSDEIELFDGPGGYAPADFDGDGRLDFAERGAVYWNEGGFHQLTKQMVQSLAEGLCAPLTAAGDWDGDGLLDAAFVCERYWRDGHRHSKRVAVYRNLGSRRFELLEAHDWDGFGRMVVALVTGDVDGDGDPDLAVGLSALGARSDDGRHVWAEEPAVVEVLRNDGSGHFQLAGRELMDQGAGGLYARDLDRDGDDDLVVSGGGSAAVAQVKLLLSRGDGGFEETRTYAVDGHAHSVVAEDLDGDGRLDLAVTQDAHVSVLLNEAPRRGPDSGVRGCGGTFFRRGDLEGDGDSDLWDARPLLYYLFAGAEEPRCLKAADVDDSGWLGVSDAVLVIRYFFGFVPGLPAPFPGCGPDPTEDALSCKKAVACR